MATSGYFQSFSRLSFGPILHITFQRKDYYNDPAKSCDNKNKRKFSFIFLQIIYRKLYFGPGSSVGIATGYGLDGPGIEW